LVWVNKEKVVQGGGTGAKNFLKKRGKRSISRLERGSGWRRRVKTWGRKKQIRSMVMLVMEGLKGGGSTEGGGVLCVINIKREKKKGGCEPGEEIVKGKQSRTSARECYWGSGKEGNDREKKG